MWGYKQASTKEQKDIKMWECKVIHNSNVSNMCVTSRLHVGYSNLLHTSLYTLYA